MVSYFERRKKPPLRHALSSHPLSLSFLIPLPIQLSALAAPFPTLEKLATPRRIETHHAEKVAFGSELDNVGSARAHTIPVIYSAPQPLWFTVFYKGIVLFKALTSILCPRHFLFPGCSPGLSLIMYGAGKQWPSARRALGVESVTRRQAFFSVPKTFILFFFFSS